MKYGPLPIAGEKSGLVCLHRLTSAFILGYHGCDQRVGERLLTGMPFKLSNNDYDWLGPGIYFWDANPLRGLEFAVESSRRKGLEYISAVRDRGSYRIGFVPRSHNVRRPGWVRIAYGSLVEVTRAAGLNLPSNSKDKLRRNLDYAVVRRLHTILEAQNLPAIDTVKGVFTEGPPAYPGAGFREKTHIQIAVRNARCIKGVFRVPPEQLRS
jgi:hypothetical protein